MTAFLTLFPWCIVQICYIRMQSLLPAHLKFFVEGHTCVSYTPQFYTLSYVVSVGTYKMQRCVGMIPLRLSGSRILNTDKGDLNFNKC